jgi:hypothetical protein
MVSLRRGDGGCRAVLVLLACMAAAGCSPRGRTCGRGRCTDGACVNVISTGASFNDLSPDWWCVVPCSGDLGCPETLCLQSPVESGLQVCAGNMLEIKYRIGGQKISGEVANSIRITGAHVDGPSGGTVDCQPDQVCSAGWFSSGEMLPTVEGNFPSGTKRLFNGTPGRGMAPAESAPNGSMEAPLGPLLPTGLDIVIQLDGPMDETYQ